jgi:hypothetical protein
MKRRFKRMVSDFVLNLNIGIYLGFGAWDLEFGCGQRPPWGLSF